ncbi:MAG TPA: hypothetical protein VGK65_07965, partial [Candidatus Binatia bacterium]
MKLYFGLLESFAPHQPRIFTEVSGKLVDLNLACAARFAQVEPSSAYELAAFYFPDTIAVFFQRGEQALKEL